MKCTIVSFSDEKYFPLLKELISSIRDLDVAGKCGISILNGGMRDDQLREISDQVSNMKNAEWDFDLPHLKKEPEYRKAFTCRPFLPKYFPGYDIYLWIDADAWVSDWHAIEMFIEGASRGAIALTTEVDRAYARIGGFKRDYVLGVPIRFKPYLYTRTKAAFGRKLAYELALHPGPNVGAFAIHRDAPHWEVWADYLEKALAPGRMLFGAEEVAMKFVVYRESMKAELLPAWCSWICAKCVPLIDADTGKLVEPYLPHHPIGVVQLATLHKIRADPSVTVEVRSTDGSVYQRSLRYPAFQRA